MPAPAIDTNSQSFHALKRRLGLSRWQAMGIIQALYRFAEEQSPAGDVGRFSDHYIARSIEWSGPPAELVRALVDAGYLANHHEHRLVVAGWRQVDPVNEKWLKAGMVMNQEALLVSKSATVRTLAEKALLYTLACHADPATGETVLSRVEIAEELGICESYAKKVIKSLIMFGSLTVNQGGGRGHRSVYRLKHKIGYMRER